MASSLRELTDHATIQNNENHYFSADEQKEIIIALAIERIFKVGFISFNQHIKIDSFTTATDNPVYPFSIFDVVYKTLKRESYNLCIVPSSFTNIKKEENDNFLVHIALCIKFRYK